MSESNDRIIPQELIIHSMIMREDLNNPGTYFQAQVDGIGLDGDEHTLLFLADDDDVLISTKGMASLIPLSRCKGILMTPEWMDKLKPLIKSERGFYTLEEPHQKKHVEVRFVIDNEGVVHCSVGDDERGTFLLKRRTVHGMQSLLFQLMVNY